MAQFPALPVWTDTLLADCGHLSDEELGIYLKIVIFIWRSPGCRLPNDITFLSRKFNRSAEAFEKQVFPVMREFCQNNGNWWTKESLTKEYEFLLNRRQKNRDNANKRWNKDNEPCEGNAPTLTPISKKESKRPTNVGTKASRFYLDTMPSEWQTFSVGERPDLNPESVFAQFADYWKAKPGKDACKLDWFATWRNWVRNQKYAKPNDHKNTQPQKQKQIDILDEMRENNR